MMPGRRAGSGVGNYNADSRKLGRKKVQLYYEDDPCTLPIYVGIKSNNIYPRLCKQIILLYRVVNKSLIRNTAHNTVHCVGQGWPMAFPDTHGTNRIVKAGMLPENYRWTSTKGRKIRSSLQNSFCLRKNKL